MYTISEVATKVKLSQKRIREYEKEGFVRPQREPRTNNRMFSDHDVKVIQRLSHLIHKKGFTISSLKQLMKLAPCWKIFECDEADTCPVYLNAADPCWVVVSRLQGTCKLECVDCPVYLNAGTEEVKIFDKDMRPHEQIDEIKEITA